MSKVLYVLAALLIASPAMAVPNVDITCTPGEGGWVTIGYNVTRGPAEPRLRALALEVEASTGKIVAVRGYKTGESTAASKGYGIFPGSIGLADPQNPVWGDPIAPDTDPGAEGTGLGTNKVILEMGSLYDSGAPGNEPAEPTGALCQLRFSNTCTVSVKAEKDNRGGIVMEDPDADVTTNVTNLTPLCSPVWTYTGPETTEWGNVGSPSYWEADRQCYGDADAGDEPFGRGMVGVGLNDVPILLAGYRVDEFYYTNPGDDPWIAADFDHAKEPFGRGWVSVGLDDISILLTYYRIDNLSPYAPPYDCSP